MDRVHVELDIFSGRPNPVWELPESFLSKLGSLLKNLPAEPPFAEYDGLGYRGFLISEMVYDGSVFSNIRIYRNTLKYIISGRNYFCRVVDYPFEMELLETGKVYLAEGVYGKVKREIGG